jgi:hypothetical protein
LQRFHSSDQFWRHGFVTTVACLCTRTKHRAVGGVREDQPQDRGGSCLADDQRRTRLIRHSFTLWECLGNWVTKIGKLLLKIINLMMFMRELHHAASAQFYFGPVL